MSEHLPRALLEAYARDELVEDERVRVASHLEDCAACHEALVDIEFDLIPLPSRPEDPAEIPPPSASLQSFPLAGAQVGPYRLREELGRGGQARVFLAEDTRLERLVALKLFDAARLPSSHVLERFHREAAALSKLEHPGICTVYGVGEHLGQPYIAMRYVAGESLAQRIERCAARPLSAGGPEGTESLLLLLEGAARALHVAHHSGLVHRDIKPSNILITRDEEPVLVDFGLARDISSQGPSLTRTGDLVGTPAYMAPELLRGDERAVDRRTDVFSLGVTLYEALTCSLPFDAATTAGVFQRILSGSWTPPSREGKALTRDLCVILETALDPDPNLRYQTALAFAEDLRRFRERKPILARPAGMGLRLRRWAQRNPVTAAALGVVLLTLTTGLGVSSVLLNRLQKEGVARTAAQRGEEGLRLAFQSSLLLADEPGRALLLGIEAVRRSPGVVENSALVDALCAPRERARLLGHTGSVSQAVFSPDGQGVATASDDRTARLWDASSGTPLLVLRGHEAELQSVAWSPDRSRILTAARDGTARLWDARSGQELLRVAGDGPRMLLARFSPDGSRFLAVGEKVATLRETSTGRLLHSFEGHRHPISAADFSPDGTLVATGAQDRVVRLWETISGTQRSASSGHPQTISALAFGRGGQILATADFTGPVFLWSTDTGQQTGRLLGHEHPVRTVTLSPDGTLAATGSDDFTARLWNVATGAQLLVLQHDQRLSTVELSPDGAVLLTAAQDGVARLWDTSTGALVRKLKGHGGGLTHAAFAPRAEQLVTASADFTARIWPAEQDWPRVISGSLAGSVERAWVDPAGNRVAALTEPGAREVHMAKLGDTSSVVLLSGHSDVVTSVQFQPGNAHVLTTARDGTSRLWAADDGKPLREFRGHSGPVLTAHFCADGSSFATGSEDETVRVWDTATGVERTCVTGARGACFVASLSPDGQHVICGAKDGSLRLARVAGGEVLRALEDANRHLRSVEWSPDGRRIVVANATSRVQVRDPFTGKDLGALLHPSRSDFAVYSPDGRWIGTECHDFVVRVWDAVSQEEVLRVQLKQQQLGAISFCAGRPWILAHRVPLPSQLARGAPAVGTLVAFPLEPLEEALRLRPGELTPDERDRFLLGTPEERAAHRASWKGGEAFGAR